MIEYIFPWAICFKFSFNARSRKQKKVCNSKKRIFALTEGINCYVFIQKWLSSFRFSSFNFSDFLFAWTRPESLRSRYNHGFKMRRQNPRWVKATTTRQKCPLNKKTAISKTLFWSLGRPSISMNCLLQLRKKIYNYLSLSYQKVSCNRRSVNLFIRIYHLLRLTIEKHIYLWY